VGFLIVDQCTTANLKIFFNAVGPFSSTYMLGLARSKRRADGLTDLMHAYIGPLLGEINAPGPHAGARGPLPKFTVQSTGFCFDYRENYGEMINALCRDSERNGLIAADILQETAENHRLALVVSERKEHLNTLWKHFGDAHKRAQIVTGKTSEARLKKVLTEAADGKLAVVLVTLKSIPRVRELAVRALFIASPIKFGEHLTEAAGQLFANGRAKKPAVIYDYADKPNVLKASLNSRLKTYRLLGIEAKA
jgi:hypothetical protein